MGYYMPGIPGKRDPDYKIFCILRVHARNSLISLWKKAEPRSVNHRMLRPKADNHAYGIKAVDGYTYLTKERVVNSDSVSVGDRVDILALPDGKFYLDKTVSENTIAIEKITLSHVFFEGVIVEETI